MQTAAASLPRALDVQKFAAAREQEIRALQQAIKDSEEKFGASALPRHLRRRTRSHNPYKHAKRPNLKRLRCREEDKGEETSTQWSNRRMRRRTGRLQRAFQQSSNWDVQTLAKDSTAEGCCRLETHIWHSKRLKVIERWGWHLPEGATGRGRGSRSFIHQLRSSATLHDSSYWCPLQLAGTAASILCMMRGMLSPRDAKKLQGHLMLHHTQQVRQGHAVFEAAAAGGWSLHGWEVEVVMHHSGRFPLGAIAPVKLMHLAGEGAAEVTRKGQVGAAKGATDSHPEQLISRGEPAAMPAAGGVDLGLPCEHAHSQPHDQSGLEQAEAVKNGTQADQSDGPAPQLAHARPAASPVRLCLWVHAAAALEAYQALCCAAAGLRGSPQGLRTQPQDHIPGTAGDQPGDLSSARRAANMTPGSVASQALEFAGAGADAFSGVNFRTGMTTGQDGSGNGEEDARRSPVVDAPHQDGVEVRVLNLRRVEVHGLHADATLAAAFSPLQQLAMSSGLAGQQHAEQEGRPDDSGRGALGDGHSCRQAGQGEGASAGAREGAAGASLAWVRLQSLQEGQVLQVVAPDPRLSKPVAVGSASASLLEGTSCPSFPSLLDPATSAHLPPPAPEAALSSRRQQARRDLVGLEQGSMLAGGGPPTTPAATFQGGVPLADALAGAEADPAAPHKALEGSLGQGRQDAAEKLQGEGRQQGGSHCPLVLVRHRPTAECGLPGWSLVLPAGWVTPFWMALVHAGAKPAGQREWHWVHTLQGRPFFPQDFPDTQAYTALMEQLRTQQQQEAARRPKGKFTPAAPYPPLWPEAGAGRLLVDPDLHARQVHEQAWQQSHQGGGTSGVTVQLQAGAAGSPLQAPPADASTAPTSAVLAPLAPAIAGGAAVQPGPTLEGSLAGSTCCTGVLAVARDGNTVSRFLWGEGESHGGECTVSEEEGAEEYAGLSLMCSRGRGGGSGPASRAARPVAVALAQGRLQWRQRAYQASGSALGVAPKGGAQREQQGDPALGGGQTVVGMGAPGELERSGRGGCLLVEVTVRMVKRGVAREGAEVLGDFDEREDAPKSRPDSRLDPATAPTRPTPPPGLRLLGFVTSQAPRGAPHWAGALGCCCAASLWRLRSRQYVHARRDKGGVRVWVRNPNSSALHPADAFMTVEGRA